MAGQGALLRASAHSRTTVHGSKAVGSQGNASGMCTLAPLMCINEALLANIFVAYNADQCPCVSVCRPVQMYTEAAVLSRLNHPCIVHFWGVVPVEDSKAQGSAAEGASASRDKAGPFGSRAQASGRSSISSRLSLGLVMDRCDESLEALLRVKPLLPLPEAIHIAECIADGLNYLHTHAPLTVVHGDLKPANVLIKRATQEVLLTDFGLSSTIAVHTLSMGAKHLQQGQGAAGRATGCTLYWAAPEMLQAWEDGQDAAHTLASDVYAFGVILYQLLVGKAPYASMFKSEGALKGAVRRGVRPSWGGWEEARDGEAGPDVLKGLQVLVEACWAPTADERPPAQVVHTQLVELQQIVAAP